MAVISRLFIELAVRHSKVSKGMKGALRSVASGIATIERVATIGLGAAVAGFTALTVKAIDTIDELKDLSDQTGVSVKTLGGLKLAAEQGGTSLEAVVTGIQRMQKANPKLDNTEDAFAAIAEQIRLLPTAAEKSAKAMEVFGKAGGKLINVLNLGKAGIGAMVAEAKALGLVLSGEQVRAIERVADGWVKLKLAVTGAFAQVAATISPSLDMFETVLIGTVSQAGLLKTAFAAVAEEIHLALTELVIISRMLPALKTQATVGIAKGGSSFTKGLLFGAEKLADIISAVPNALGVGAARGKNVDLGQWFREKRSNITANVKVLEKIASDQMKAATDTGNVGVASALVARQNLNFKEAFKQSQSGPGRMLFGAGAETAMQQAGSLDARFIGTTPRVGGAAEDKAAVKTDRILELLAIIARNTGLGLGLT